MKNYAETILALEEISSLTKSAKETEFKISELEQELDTVKSKRDAMYEKLEDLLQNIDECLQQTSELNFASDLSFTLERYKALNKKELDLCNQIGNARTEFNEMRKQIHELLDGLKKLD